MEVRVVWGLSATMAILAPTTAFRSVDLPAFGRPRMETKPERNAEGSVMSDGLGLANTHLRDAQGVAGEHFDADALAFGDLAGLRHVAQPLGNQPADGGGLGALLRAEFEQVVEPRQVETTRDDVAAVAVFLDVGVRLVLVADLAQDDLDQVLHGSEAGRIAVLVHH